MDNDTKKIVKIILIIFAFAAGILLAYFARSAIVILVTAIFIATIIDRPVTFLDNHLPKGGRTTSTLIVVFITVAVITLAVFTIIPVFIEQTINFTKTFPEKISALQSHFFLISNFIEKYNLQSQYNSLVNDAINFSKNIAVMLGSSSVTIVGGLVNGIVNFVFIIVLTFSFVATGKKNLAKILSHLYINKKREARHEKIIGRLANVIADFFVGQVTIAFIAGILVCLVVFILSLIFGFTSSIALPAGLLIFITSFIPIFGAFIGVTVLTLLVLLYSPLAALIFLAFYVVYQQVEGNFISPKVHAKKLNMPPVMVLISIIFGLKLFGAVGAIIAIPLGGCLVILFKEFIEYRKNNVIKKRRKNEQRQN